MAEPAASTAYGPMVIVALEDTMPPENQIINDPLAYQMLPLYMKGMVNACRWKPIRNLFFTMIDKNMPGLRVVFPCRKRYMNAKTLEAIEAGIKSIVILGAGLDTLAYRVPQASQLQVYEVDLPENIDYKRKKLTQIFGKIPDHVRLIPINFEHQKLDDALIEQGYSFEQKTLFVWEAVTQYLSESAVRDTFAVLSKATAGSRLVFTFVLQDFMDGTNTYNLAGLRERFVVKDRVWHFGINAADVANFIHQYGWEEIEQVGSDEFEEHYLKPAHRTETITPIERVAYAKKLPD